MERETTPTPEGETAGTAQALVAIPSPKLRTTTAVVPSQRPGPANIVGQDDKHFLIDGQVEDTERAGLGPIVKQ